MRIFGVFVALNLAMSTVAPAVLADDLPLTCCPQTCRSVEQAAVTRSRADGMPSEVWLRGFGTLKVLEDAISVSSPDGKLHVCVGYGPFGDPHIKCILVPQAMM